MADITTEIMVGGKRFPIDILMSRNRQQGDNRRLEFYSPEETRSPNPGRATIEVLDPELKGKNLSQAIRGEIVHFLPQIDPGFEQLRIAFWKEMPQWQRDLDFKAYQKSGDTRPFGQWMRQHRLDQWLIGNLFPLEGGEDWSEGITERQKRILNAMKQRLPKFEMPNAK